MMLIYNHLDKLMDCSTQLTLSLIPHSEICKIKSLQLPVHLILFRNIVLNLGN